MPTTLSLFDPSADNTIDHVDGAELVCGRSLLQCAVEGLDDVRFSLQNYEQVRRAVSWLTAESRVCRRRLVPTILTWMLVTHSCVMEAILPLLAPGGLSWLREASCESNSVMMLVAIVAAADLAMPAVSF